MPRSWIHLELDHSHLPDIVVMSLISSCWWACLKKRLYRTEPVSSSIQVQPQASHKLEHSCACGQTAGKPSWFSSTPSPILFLYLGVGGGLVNLFHCHGLNPEPYTYKACKYWLRKWSTRSPNLTGSLHFSLIKMLPELFYLLEKSACNRLK